MGEHQNNLITRKGIQEPAHALFPVFTHTIHALSNNWNLASRLYTELKMARGSKLQKQSAGEKWHCVPVRNTSSSVQLPQGKGEPAGWLIDQLVGCLVVWLVDWLAGCLV